MKDAKAILIETLAERSIRNPGYSVRAFARDLGISPQQLSNVMTGRRGFSETLASQVATRLDLDRIEREMFVGSLKARFARSATQKAVARATLEQLKSQAGSRSLELDLFKTISNGHHFALIELIKISRRRKDLPAWYARRLGISVNEVLLSLSRLERLELITKTAHGWKVNQDVVVADRAIPTEAVRNYHRQILEKAISALSLQNSEERYGSSSTIPVRVKNVERARKLIQEFRTAFTEELSDDESGDEVFALSVQFFRLTQPVNSEEK